MSLATKRVHLKTSLTKMTNIEKYLGTRTKLRKRINLRKKNVK